jgi:hypothetical protein
MKIPKISRPSKEGVNTGFKQQDQYTLDKESPLNAPKTQIITPLHDEEDTRKFCAQCNSILIHFAKSQKYVCSHCGAQVSEFTDTPQLTNTDQGMQPYQSQHFNPNNPEGEPYFVSFNPDSGDTTINKDYEVTYSAQNGRIKKIKCHGFPSDISINAFND